MFDNFLVTLLDEFYWWHFLFKGASKSYSMDLRVGMSSDGQCARIETSQGTWGMLKVCLFLGNAVAAKKKTYIFVADDSDQRESDPKHA